MPRRELRSKQISVSVEFTVHELMERLVAKMDESLSGYVHGLIVKDLMERGLLTKEMFMRLTLGGILSDTKEDNDEGKDATLRMVQQA